MKKLLTALGTLTVGAAAMYLSDPEHGQQRRALLKRRFSSAADEALEVLDQAGREAAGRLQEVADEGRNAGSGLLRRAEALAEDAAGQGREASRQGLAWARRLAHAGRERWQSRAVEARPDRRSAGPDIAMLLAAGVAVGAALFLLNSQQGRRRLAMARDSLAKLTHRPVQEEPLGQGSHMAELGAPAEPWRPDRPMGHEHGAASLH